MSDGSPAAQVAFLETKEYRRFAEFCDACRQQRYIGLCYGLPGVGKTLSTWRYARWQLIQPFLPERFYDQYRLLSAEKMIAETVASNLGAVPPELGGFHCILYTPTVANTAKRVMHEIQVLRSTVNFLVDVVQSGLPEDPLDAIVSRRTRPDPTDLIIIDEADRLNTASLEQVRDIYDRDNNIGLILIGMPGLEKRLARYPQLYSRVGFVHEFHTLSAEESAQFLEQQWRQWGLVPKPDNPTHAEAVAAIIRITNGNFRLLNRLLAQIERLVDINALKGISKELVEVARQQLVIGPG